MQLPSRSESSRGAGVQVAGCVAALLAFMAIASACGGEAAGPVNGASSPVGDLTTLAATPLAVDESQRERERMVGQQIEKRDIDDPRVLDAMRSVPRHRFVPERYRGRAYEDSPLPIGEGQTISQPYIVALMTQLLDVDPGDKILEVGTGSGYQAAILAEMGAEVYSIEIIPVLAARTRPLLDELGYGEIETRTADGYFGWEEHAPFDGIMVTAAPDHIPPPLLEQLKLSGKMVVPVGPQGAVQTLWLIERSGDRWVSRNQGSVLFVPLVQGR